mmetsp:Transcript_67279/g.156192  ORF Transcript_67279/g.156192 Transcript_67279/m.156192 type:complete len:96 (-) Transcript_67279:393-680(-)
MTRLCTTATAVIGPRFRMKIAVESKRLRQTLLVLSSIVVSHSGATRQETTEEAASKALAQGHNPLPSTLPAAVNWGCARDHEAQVNVGVNALPAP